MRNLRKEAWEKEPNFVKKIKVDCLQLEQPVENLRNLRQLERKLELNDIGKRS